MQLLSIIWNADPVIFRFGPVNPLWYTLICLAIIIVSLVVTIVRSKQKMSTADIVSFFAYSILAAVIIGWFLLRNEVEIRWYGLLWAIGLFLGMLVMQRALKIEQCPPEWSDQIFFYAAIGCIIGARLGHCWFYEWHLNINHETMLGFTPQYINPYITHPLRLLDIQEGGLSSHGGAFGIITSIWILNKRTIKRGFIWIMDKLVLGICVTGACIRFGNFMNSEIYGNPTDLPWGVVFKHNGDTWASHPTQIYEMLYCLITLAILWTLMRTKQIYKYVGLIFGIFLEGIFLTRFIIEFIKLDQEAFESNFALNMGQLLSIPFIIWGIWLIYRALNNAKNSEQQLNSAT